MNNCICNYCLKQKCTFSCDENCVAGNPNTQVNTGICARSVITIVGVDENELERNMG